MAMIAPQILFVHNEATGENGICVGYTCRLEHISSRGEAIPPIIFSVFAGVQRDCEHVEDEWPVSDGIVLWT